MTDQQSAVEALAQAIFMEDAVAQHNALLAHLDAVENEPKTSPRPWRLNPEWLAHRGCGEDPSPILDANNEEVFDISEWLSIKAGDLDLILTAVNGIPPAPDPATFAAGAEAMWEVCAEDVDCTCQRCHHERFPERMESLGDLESWLHGPGWPYACHQCGNKRCPHHADHRFVCTGSNAVDQVGVLIQENEAP